MTKFSHFIPILSDGIILFREFGPSARSGLAHVWLGHARYRRGVVRQVAEKDGTLYFYQYIRDTT